MHETAGLGVDFCGMIALGGAHGLAEGVREVAVVQSNPRGEEREDLVGTGVGDEDVEILWSSKMSERCPAFVDPSRTHLLCNVKLTPHDGKLVAPSV